jgi:formylglycine-generating enzyme required for sulfatase activity
LRQRLAAALAEGEPQRVVKLRAGLLATRGDAAQVEPLADALLTLPVAEFGVVRELLAAKADPAVAATLWERANDQQHVPAQQRFQAAVALARLAPAEPRWSVLAPFIARHLASLPAADLVAWRPLLEPVRAVLTPEVAHLVAQPNLDPIARRAAAETLADYARDDGKVIAEAMVQSDPATFEVLWSAAAQNRETAVQRLEEELVKSEIPTWTKTSFNPAWIEMTEGVRQRIRDAMGEIADDWAYCLRLRVDEAKALCEEMRPTGYRPISLWSWQENNQMLAALIWRRDGENWQIEGPLAPSRILAMDQQFRERRLCPAAVDRLPGNENKFLAIWGPASSIQHDAAESENSEPRLFRSMSTLLPTTWRLKTYRQEEAQQSDTLLDLDRVARQQPLVDQDEPGFSQSGLHPTAEKAREFEKTLLVLETPVVVNDSGEYWLRIKSLQPLRVTVDEELVVDRWSTPRGEPTETELDVSLSAGAHRIRIEAYHETGELCLYASVGMLGLGIDGGQSVRNRETPDPLTIVTAWGQTATALRDQVHNHLLRGFRPAAFRFFSTTANNAPAFGVTCERRLATDEQLDAQRERKARAAFGLARLEHQDSVWPHLAFVPRAEEPDSQDPSLRTEILHGLAEFHIPLDTIVRRLENGLSERATGQRDAAQTSILQALLKALGGYTGELTATERQQVIQRLKLGQLYETDADAGLHGACEWVLRTWGETDFLAEAVVRLSKDRPQPPAPHQGDPTAWFINSQRQTFVVFPPGVVTMGSPPQERGHKTWESLHQRHIQCSFAIATTEITRDQYAVFAQRTGIDQRGTDYSRTLQDPQTRVTWLEAALYCNWLSEQDGLDVCYEIDLQSNPPKAEMKENFLELNGYRLPTEAEWEYACRAGVGAAWSDGRTEARLSRSAWFLKNSDDHLWPVGSLKPNEAGLFDMAGNAWEWCQERYLDYPQDIAIHAILLDRQSSACMSSNRVLRGGSFDSTSIDLRAANRGGSRPGGDYDVVSFRPSRTYP